MITSLSRSITIALAACAARALSCSPLTAGEQLSTPDNAPTAPVSQSWSYPENERGNLNPETQRFLRSSDVPQDFVERFGPGNAPPPITTSPPQLLVQRGRLKPNDQTQELSEMFRRAGVGIPDKSFIVFSLSRSRLFYYSTKANVNIIENIISGGPSIVRNIKTSVTTLEVPSTNQPNLLVPELRRAVVIDTMEIVGRNGERSIGNGHSPYGIVFLESEPTVGEERFTSSHPLKATIQIKGGSRITTQFGYTARRSPIYQQVAYDPKTGKALYLKIDTQISPN